MSDKIELGMLCGVLQSNFLRLSQSESRTQPCHVRINYEKMINITEWLFTQRLCTLVVILV